MRNDDEEGIYTISTLIIVVMMKHEGKQIISQHVLAKTMDKESWRDDLVPRIKVKCR